ncbi:MAG: signal peptidase II [Oliverpabstia sp.]|nr:signal peptidase II [Oliverpabstia sp.]
MIWVSVAAAIFAADSMIKYWAEKKLSDKAVREVAKDKILLRKLHNKGMACNMGEDHPEVVKMGTLTLWGLCCAGFYRLLRHPGKNLEKAAGAFVIGGGASNLADRLFRGYVVDYFSFNVKWEKLRRLVFNLSDIFVIMGALLSLAAGLKRKRQ